MGEIAGKVGVFRTWTLKVYRGTRVNERFYPDHEHLAFEIAIEFIIAFTHLVSTLALAMMCHHRVGDSPTP